MPNADHNRDVALALAEAGFSIFPCNAHKRPLIKWRTLSSSDLEAIDEMWRRYPGALPAIDLAKAGLFVLDGDRHGGPDGVAALRALLKQQLDFNAAATPTVLTGNKGIHTYFLQNGRDLGNAEGDLPVGINARGFGGYTIAPGSTLSAKCCWRCAPGTADLVEAYKTGSIPHVPEGVVALIQARRHIVGIAGEQHTTNDGARCKAWAETALEGCVEELSAAKVPGRNQLCYKLALRLGRMLARGWLNRDDVETQLYLALETNAYVRDEGDRRALDVIERGITNGLKYPHPGPRDDDSADDGPAGDNAEKPAPDKPGAPQYPKITLDELHTIFRKWLGEEYDTDTIDAVLAAAACERLTGDPLWLLVISGPGNAKTETVQALAGAGAQITSTIASEGALLSATSRRERNKKATGGLLRKLGDRGVLVIKDLTSILSADRNTRTGVLAAIREVYDGRWERNVGTDGGATLTWTGRIVIVGAVTTAWDAAHAVIAAMGDRFVVIRADSGTGRVRSGRGAIRNTGGEVAMRQELAVTVGGVIGHASTVEFQFSDDEVEQLVKAADIVTMARTGVERDYKGEVIDAHAPEMPTRYAKQLAQMIRGAVAIGMTPEAGMRLAIRCACDSIPPLRRLILLDVAKHPNTTPREACRRIGKPRSTIRKEMDALHALGMLKCTEEDAVFGDSLRTVSRYALAPGFDLETLRAMGQRGPVT